ncbi:hypothetical protein EDD86DRAFT_208054 [Gorgonomyces haynaldii]|nr:hypothetical protein EDD86DRAFT_208054 [Gorgonomyces haynaldii]
MTFQVHDTPSGTVFFTGKLTQKTLVQKAKRSILMCIPQSTQDIEMIHDELTLNMALKKKTEEITPEQIEQAAQENLTIFGHICLSAISGFPLLIIGSQAKVFCHFSQISDIKDEHDLSQPCTFALVTPQSEFRFTCDSSTDYQQWIGAFTQAFENIQTRADKFRPSSPAASSLAATMPRASSTLSISHNPDDFLETHRTIANRRLSRPRSISGDVSEYSRRQSRDLSNVSLPQKKSIFQKVKDFFKRKDDDESKARRRKSFSFFAKEQ